MVHFPLLSHIDEVLPAICGADEFKVMEKDDYTVIDYVFSTDRAFPDPSEPGLSTEQSLHRAIRRECRGLKFDKVGKLIARAYGKFFNLNEKPETQEHLIDFSQPNVMLDKLDGSMIHTILLNGKVRLMTRKGFSEVALKAERWLETLPEDRKAAYNSLMNGYSVSEYTHCFEYVAPHNQIVVFYEQELMILTAIRHIETGQYIEYAEMVAEADRCGVPVVQPYPLACFDAAAVRDDPTNEGLVVRFANGSMVKVKADIYCAKHGAVDSVSHCHGVLELAFANVLDDVLPNLSGEFKQRVIDYRDAFFEALEGAKTKLVAMVEEHDALDQKSFALAIKANPWRGHMFSYRKLRDADKVLHGYIERTSFKGKRVQEVCEELGLPYENDLGRW